jgi:hypothetical protein
MSKYGIDIYIYNIIHTYIHTLWDNPFFRGRTGRQVWVSNAVVLGGWLVSLTSLAGLARDFDLMLCQGQLFQTTLKTTFTELVPVAVGRGIHWIHHVWKLKLGWVAQFTITILLHTSLCWMTWSFFVFADTPIHSFQKGRGPRLRGFPSEAIDDTIAAIPSLSRPILPSGCDHGIDGP